MLSHALHASFQTKADQRVADRRVLRLEARIATETGEGGIRVHNLSRSGLLIEGSAAVAAGAHIEVELPGGTRHRAEVIWADDTLFGCRFANPLTQAQLSAALLRAAPAEPAQDGTVKPLTPPEALAKLRQHWELEPEIGIDAAVAEKLSPGKRLWIMFGLSLASWAVPAAAWILL